MNLASAYPNSNLSAPVMTAVAVVMACTLAAWLILVFLADRQPRGRRASLPRAEENITVRTEEPAREPKEHPAVTS